VETLAPRELYDSDELGMWKRMPLFGALLFAAFSMVWDVIFAMSRSEPLVPTLLRALIPSLFGGIIWALLFTWVFRRLVKTGNDRWYFGDPRLVAPPPPGFLYRLPCAWFASDRRRHGILYLGREGLTFDPVVRLPRRFRDPLVITPLDAVDVEVVDAPLPFIARIWGHRTIPRIRVRWNARHADFGVPGAREIGERLREKVAALRERPLAAPVDPSPA
jgi:hypothetical protein